jgi:hypothetical protein
MCNINRNEKFWWRQMMNRLFFLNDNAFDFPVFSDLILTAIEFPENRGRNTVRDLVFGSYSLV